MPAPAEERPIAWFRDEASVRGMLYLAPAQPRAACVICNPIFEERKSAHRVLVDCARTLAAGGITTLRFDYRACGDSDGEAAALTLATAVADTQTAIDVVRRESGANVVHALGLRVGAAIAARAAQAGELERLLLWQPTVSGADYLRAELRKKLMKEMIGTGTAQTRREGLDAQIARGESIDFDGHVLSAALYTELQALDLAAEPLPDLQATRIVGIGPSTQLSRELETLRSAWAAGPNVDAEAMRLQPFWNLIGMSACPDLIAATCDWLRT